MGQFSDKVRAFEVKTELKLDTAVRKISLQCFTEVILKSPVDTGRFRGNWMVAIGAIPAGTLEIEDKSGQVTISKVDAATMALHAGDVIYLANNLPYASRLEDGYSTQAPGGMVRLTAQRFQTIVNAVAEGLK